MLVQRMLGPRWQCSTTLSRCPPTSCAPTKPLTVPSTRPTAGRATSAKPRGSTPSSSGTPGSRRRTCCRASLRLHRRRGDGAHRLPNRKRRGRVAVSESSVYLDEKASDQEVEAVRRLLAEAGLDVEVRASYAQRSVV